jgi:hypothetical protein
MLATDLYILEIKIKIVFFINCEWSHYATTLNNTKLNRFDSDNTLAYSAHS